MILSPLAASIYQVLRNRVPSVKPELAYTELVESLPNPFNTVGPDSEMLAAALGELVTRCRAKGLPAISAMVVRYRERVPGPGYYKMAHPDVAHDPAKAAIAWGHELEKVRVTSYPPTI